VMEPAFRTQRARTIGAGPAVTTGKGFQTMRGRA